MEKDKGSLTSAVSDVGERHRGNEGDGKVHKPAISSVLRLDRGKRMNVLDGRRDTHALSTHVEREYFGGHNPRKRSPFLSAFIPYQISQR